MSVLARFSPPSMTAEKYDELVSLLYSKGVHPAEGLELEVCYGSGDQMRVSVLFDTIEQLEAFGNKIKPLHLAVSHKYLVQASRRRLTRRCLVPRKGTI